MSWANDAVFYHLYPLGALPAPERNDLVSPPPIPITKGRANIPLYPNWARILRIE